MKQIPHRAFGSIRNGKTLFAGPVRYDGWDVGGIEDEVVTLAVAVGAGDAEAVAGGSEGEGEFGNLSAALGGLFALVGGFRVRNLRAWLQGRGFTERFLGESC